MMILATSLVLALAGGDGDLPRTLGQEQAEAPPPRPQNLDAPRDGAAHDVFSFGRVQASARIGVVAFSEDFEADAELLGSLAARVDWPWMSRDVFGFAEDRIGVYADVSLTRIDRDLFFLENQSGTVFLLGFGLDVNIYEDETCVFRGQLGGQYGNFGDADDTDDGVSGVLGLDVGFKLSESVLLVLNPQIAFGNAGDQLYIANVGVQVRF
jgi:hypothetical protein